MTLKEIKPEIRIVGFDDCPFKFGQKETTVVGAVFRGGEFLDGLIVTKIKVDGLDSTEKLVKTINSSPHKCQIRAIMLNGITFGGFNFVDIKKLFDCTGLPVIVVINHKPNIKSIKVALDKLKNKEQRIKIMSSAGNIRPVKIKNSSATGKLYYQTSGLKPEIAEKIIKLTATRSIVPEPLRIAHMICSGLKN